MVLDWRAGAVLLVLLVAAGSSAGAANPPAVTIDPSSSSRNSAGWDGSALLGVDDPAGQSYSKCKASGPPNCEQVVVHVVAPAAWAEAHSVTLKATLTSSDQGGLDVGIFDAAGNTLASNVAGSSSISVSISGLAPGDYTVQADGDIATGGTYRGMIDATAGPRRQIAPTGRGGLAFGRETVADPLRTGLEPSVLVAPDGTVYETPILGFNTLHSFIDRSTDGGQTFNTLGTPGSGKVIGSPVPGSLPVCGGGGDIDTASDGFAGDLYFVDLVGGPYVAAYASHDRGNTFVSHCQSSQENGSNTATDREWLSTDTVHHRLWYVYRDGLVGSPTASDNVAPHFSGEYLKWAPLPGTAGTAGAAQVAFQSLCRDPLGVDTACVTGVEMAGAPVTDNLGPRRGNTYLPIGAGGGVSVAVINPDASVPVVVRRVSNAPRVLFPSVAVDRAGNLYMVWADPTTMRISYAHSSDEGRTWSTPLSVNAAPARTALMPWVIAGDPGRVDIVYYASEQETATGVNYGPWNGYMAQTLDGLDRAPLFSQAPFTDRPNHLDPVCLGGLACNVGVDPSGDRQLGDFFKVALDRDGRAMISFGDTANQLGPESQGTQVVSPAFAHFVRQAAGPSLFRSVGDVPPVPVPTNGVTREPHADPVPVASPTGPGPSVDALNLTGSGARFMPDGSLEIRTTVKDLNAMAAIATPPFLGTATFLTRWTYANQVYYAAAEDNGGNWRFFSGQVQPVPAAVGVLYPAYPATGPASGSVVPGPGGSITIDVPAAAVGNPRASETLFSVTSYSMTQAAPTPPGAPAAATTLPLVADSLPAYNVSPESPPGAGPKTAAAQPGLPTTAVLPGSSFSAQVVFGTVVLCLITLGLPRRRRRPGRRGYGPTRRS